MASLDIFRTGESCRKNMSDYTTESCGVTSSVKVPDNNTTLGLTLG